MFVNDKLSTISIVKQRNSFISLMFMVSIHYVSQLCCYSKQKLLDVSHSYSLQGISHANFFEYDQSFHFSILLVLFHMIYINYLSVIYRNKPPLFCSLTFALCYAISVVYVGKIRQLK